MGRAISGPAFFVLASKSYKMGSGLSINRRAPCAAGNPSTGSGQAAGREDFIGHAYTFCATLRRKGGFTNRTSKNSRLIQYVCSYQDYFSCRKVS